MYEGTVEVAVGTASWKRRGNEEEHYGFLGKGLLDYRVMKGPLRLLWTQHHGKDEEMKNIMAFWEKVCL